MPRLQNKVDMVQMNAAIDKVLALPSTTQAEVKERRAQRKSPPRQPRRQATCRSVGQSERPIRPSTR